MRSDEVPVRRLPLGARETGARPRALPRRSHPRRQLPRRRHRSVVAARAHEADIRCPTHRSCRAAARAGVGDGVFVVAYGNMGGAERLWWLLRHFGHDECAVIDFDSWHGPLSCGEEDDRAARVRRSRPRDDDTIAAAELDRSVERAGRRRRTTPEAVGAESRIRSTRSLAGSRARSTRRGTSRRRSYRTASSSPTAARV